MDLTERRAAIAAHVCPECKLSGRRGTCAPRRCYCGHRTCHAFGSYVDRRELDASTIVGRLTPAKPAAEKTAWDERDEATWIDRM